MKIIKNDLLNIGIESLTELFVKNTLDDIDMLYPLDVLQQNWSVDYGENSTLSTESIYTLTCILKHQQQDIARYRIMLNQNEEFLDEFFNVY